MYVKEKSIMQIKRVYLTDNKKAYIDAYVADKIENFTRKAKKL